MAGAPPDPVEDMTSEELRHISRKLSTYADIYTGDKEARRMSRRCWEVAALLDAANRATQNAKHTDALRQIMAICDDNAAPACNAHMALKFIREVATS